MKGEYTTPYAIRRNFKIHFLGLSYQSFHLTEDREEDDRIATENIQRQHREAQPSYVRHYVEGEET